MTVSLAEKKLLANQDLSGVLLNAVMPLPQHIHHITTATDLVTTADAVRDGFLAQALEKTRQALPVAAGGKRFLDAGCLLLLGVASPDRTVEAEAFALRDANGELRADLGMTTDGPALVLYDANRRTRVELGMTAEGPTLSLLDGNRRTRVELSAWEAGTGSGSRLALYDANREGGVALGEVGGGADVHPLRHERVAENVSWRGCGGVEAHPLRREGGEKSTIRPGRGAADAPLLRRKWEDDL